MILSCDIDDRVAGGTSGTGNAYQKDLFLISRGLQALTEDLDREVAITQDSSFKKVLKNSNFHPNAIDSLGWKIYSDTLFDGQNYNYRFCRYKYSSVLDSASFFGSYRTQESACSLRYADFVAFFEVKLTQTNNYEYIGNYSSNLIFDSGFDIRIENGQYSINLIIDSSSSDPYTSFFPIERRLATFPFKAKDNLYYGELKLDYSEGIRFPQCYGTGRAPITGTIFREEENIGTLELYEFERFVIRDKNGNEIDFNDSLINILEIKYFLKGKISGYVKDSITNEFLKHIPVWLGREPEFEYERSIGTYRCILTDDNGYFEFKVSIPSSKDTIYGVGVGADDELLEYGFIGRDEIDSIIITPENTSSKNNILKIKKFQGAIYIQLSWPASFHGDFITGAMWVNTQEGGIGNSEYLSISKKDSLSNKYLLPVPLGPQELNIQFSSNVGWQSALKINFNLDASHPDTLIMITPEFNYKDYPGVISGVVYEWATQIPYSLITVILADLDSNFNKQYYWPKNDGAFNFKIHRDKLGSYFKVEGYKSQTEKDYSLVTSIDSILITQNSTISKNNILYVAPNEAVLNTNLHLPSDSIFLFDFSANAFVDSLNWNIAFREERGYSTEDTLQKFANKIPYGNYRIEYYVKTKNNAMEETNDTLLYNIILNVGNADTTLDLYPFLN